MYNYLTCAKKLHLLSFLKGKKNMLEAMREIALLHLHIQFATTDLDMNAIRAQYSERLAPLLVEAVEKIKRVYLLQTLPDQPGVVKMWNEEVTPDNALHLPFIQSRVAAIGPVIKRTYDKTFGPTLNTQKLTQDKFFTLSKEETPWSAYFAEMHQILFRSHTLIFTDKSYPVGSNTTYPHLLAAAINLIPEKTTVFLSVVDAQRRWPGQRSEYHAYLAKTLANKYITGEAQPHGPATCPLCGATGVTLYPNLRGTGINFSNMDRAGAFPNLDVSRAWKGYGLCLDCADLLYIFKNHLLRQQFLGNIAGEQALMLPSLLGNTAGKQQFIEYWHDYLKSLNNSKEFKPYSHEKELLELIQEQDDAQVVLHILWAKFGQVVEEVRGVITDILPSRLRQLVKYNHQANNWQHPLAPQYKMEDATFDLSLNMLKALLKRPGGKKAEKANTSTQLFAIKCQLAESIYHGKALGKIQMILWRELLTTARCYLDNVANSGNFWGLLHEGYNEKKQTYYWTMAGWIKYVARFRYYLDITGVLTMQDQTEPVFTFTPSLPALRPYFQPGSGLNSPEKAFTFMLGILYGKVLQVQGARKVNVAANALTWLKRLNLDGRDIPELYNKIREKLLSYQVETSDDVRAIIHDLGNLGGPILGDNIRLDKTATCYFLLLGQSVMVDVLPTKSKQEEA